MNYHHASARAIMRLRHAAAVCRWSAGPRCTHPPVVIVDETSPAVGWQQDPQGHLQVRREGSSLVSSSLLAWCRAGLLSSPAWRSKYSKQAVLQESHCICEMNYL